MSDRWWKRLEHLDGASPSDEVFRRAQEGPRIPDHPAPGPSTSTRVVTGIAAFAIFALAISVFAIPALRLRGDDVPRSTQSTLLPLWPFRTLDAAERAQAWVDGGAQPEELAMFGFPQGLVQPGGVAAEYGRHVMGWRAPVIEPLDAAWSGGSVSMSVGEQIVGPGPSWTPCEFDPDTGEVIRQCPISGGSVPPAIVEAKREACERFGAMFSRAPSVVANVDCSDVLPSDAASPFPTYRIRPSETATSSVTVTLFQPLSQGPGKTWAVLHVETEALRMSVRSGQIVSLGGEVSVARPDGAEGEAGIYLGIHVGNSETCNYATERLAARHGISSIEVPTQQQTSCDEYTPGYAYAYVSDASERSFDPISEGVSRPLAAFVAVPIVIHFPRGSSTSDAARPESDEVDPDDGAMWTTSPRDPYGWTVEYPQDWSFGAFDDFNGRYSATGMYVSSGDVQVRSGVVGEPDSTEPAPGEVMVKIWHREGGPAPSVADDSDLPLSFDDLRPDGDGALGLAFRGDGLEFNIRVTAGDGYGWREHDRILRRIVSSIALQPWSVGETRNGLTALVMRPEIPEAGAAGGGALVEVDGGFALVLSHEARYIRTHIDASCGEPVWEGDTLSLTVSCADGSSGSYSYEGRPAASNPGHLQDRLAVDPLIVSWDGYLLAPSGR